MPIGGNLTGATSAQQSQIGNSLTTGLLSGAFMTVNAGDPAHFDISAGVGRFVDNTTDPSNPVITEVAIGPFTDVTLTMIGTQPATPIGIDINGDIVQGILFVNFSQEDRRDIISLGPIGHFTLTSITDITNDPVSGYDIGLSLDDLNTALAEINTSGNTFSPNGVNLNMDKSAGTTFAPGSNFHNNPKLPNTFTDSALTVLTFSYFFSDGAGGVSFIFNQTDIDPDIFDDGSGTPATVPNNRFAIQRITFFSGGTNNVFIQLGQNTFMTLDDALVGIDTAVFNQAVLAGSFRAWLVVGQGTTDLSDSASAQFVEANKFGF